jgi:hypothetical protein
MVSTVYNAMGFRTGMPDDASIPGAIKFQTLNRLFYGRDAAGVERHDIVPTEADLDKGLAKYDPALPGYFDIEPWICQGKTPSDKFRRRVSAALLLDRYREKNPTSTAVLTAYAYPTGEVHPLNGAADIENWKAQVRNDLTGELSDRIEGNLDAISWSGYPTDYARTGVPVDSWETQLKYNVLVLGEIRKNTHKPVLGWWRPRMKAAAGPHAGKMVFLDYRTSVLHFSWLYANNDAVVLWDWDGDPSESEAIVTWNSDRPWLRAVRDVIAAAKAAPDYVSLVNKVLSTTPVRTLAAT